MWRSIALQISETLDQDFHLTEHQKIIGGDINEVYRISDENHHFFIKINERERYDLFIQEAFSLTALARPGQLSLPKVITHGTTKENAFLVMDYLPHMDEGEQNWILLGQQLAAHHRHTHDNHYGWDNENYIGRTVQSNKWQRNWSRFFAEQRIGLQLQLLAEQGHSLGTIDNIVEDCAMMLQHHQPQPSMVHGDLWRGNVGFSNSTPYLFDPAAYFGDREVDIAMTELFSGFPAEFYDSYQATNPLPDDYQERKQLYNLYHVLNHANLFGGSYIGQAQAIIDNMMKNNT